MFVSVKAVKDNLDFLSKCNSHVYNKINDLTKEAKDIKEKYGIFLGSVERFLLKMNADARIWDISSTQERLTNNAKDEKKVTEKKKEKATGEGRETEKETEKAEVQQKTIEDGGSLCKKCKNKDEKFVGKVGCLGCFLSNFKERSFSRLPVLSEALLGSFLASLFWMQSDRDTGSTSSTSRGKDKNGKRPHEWLNLRDSTIRMICDVCEVVEGATRGVKQTEDEERELSSSPSEETAMPGSLRESVNEVSCLYRGRKELKKTKSEESGKWKREGEMESEEESDLEETMTKPLVSSQHFDLKAKPSLMCVGDLKKTTQKKTKSVVSSAFDALPSWVEKLSTDIISKLMKKKSKASVRIFNQAYEKSNSGLKNLPGRLEFTVAATTPVGAFDVTVVQHKSRRLLRDRLTGPSSNLVQAVCTSSLKESNQGQSGGPTDPKEDIYSWSQESWQNTDSDTFSNSGESELEEFIEIFVENPTKRIQTTKRAPTRSCDLKEITYKTSKSNCFQIQKCYPVQFIQEIMQKTFTTKTVEEEEDISFREQTHLKTSTEDTLRRNDFTRQITNTSGEENQKEMVLEGPSSDLVIYIQVEMEDDSGPNTNGFFLKHQTSSLGTQTPRKEEEKEQEERIITTTTIITTEKDKTIKLKEETQEGVSLFQIWERQEKDSQEEVYCRGEEEKKEVQEDEKMKDVQEEEYHREKKMQEDEKVKESQEEPYYREERKRVEEDEKDIREEGKKVQEDEKVKDLQEGVFLRENIQEEEKGLQVSRWEKKIQKDNEKEIKVKERKEKMVTFDEKPSEIIEGELCPDKEEEVQMADAIGIDLREAKQRVDVWLLQQNLHRVQRGEMKWVQHPQVLETALKLIREIETDIVGVKLSDAISMLPRLESELRKHLHQKMKDMGEKEDSFHDFFSAIDFWPEEEKEETESETSEDRLNNLLAMLSELEEAVKTGEQSDDRLSQENSSKIYKLLQALTASIRELEGRPSVTSLSQTLEIASQLDTAVREYDNIMRRQPMEYVWWGTKADRRQWKEDRKSKDGASVMQHLKNVRKKVFEIVEEEAIVAEGRIELDFDRLDILEGENDEALMFLETFLQKTERRVVELTNLKAELVVLSSLLNALYETARDRLTETKRQAQVVETEKPEVVETKYPEVVVTIEQEVIMTMEQEMVNTTEQVVKTIDPEVASITGPEGVKTIEPEVVETKEPEVVARKETAELVHIKAPEERNVLSDSSADSMSGPLPVHAQERTEPLRETISGLLIALDTLKSKAREKKELCREILNSGTVEKVHESENSSQRSSRSSFTTKHTEKLYTTVKEFKKIGETSLYLAWTRPEGPLKDSIVGFQIHVNGKLNQKVRNPQRRQAVLYSVDLTTNVTVQLFALTEKGQTIQLDTVNYKDEECLLR